MSKTLQPTSTSYQSGWVCAVHAWLDDPCTLPDEDDQQAYQRIRETCWVANKDVPPDFWEGFKDGIETEFGINT